MGTVCHKVVLLSYLNNGGNQVLESLGVKVFEFTVGVGRTVEGWWRLHEILGINLLSTRELW